jgi:uncharacterized protein YceK
MNRLFAVVAGCAVLPVSVMLGGCGASANEDSSIAGTVFLADVNRELTMQLPKLGAGKSADAPSIGGSYGLSRAHWPVRTFDVPAGDIAHQMIYRGEPVIFAYETPSQKSVYPTVATADTLVAPERESMQVLTAIALPAQGVSDVLMLPYRMINDGGPARVVYGPKLGPSVPRQPAGLAELEPQQPIPATRQPREGK